MDFLPSATPGLYTRLSDPKLLRPWNSTILLCPDSEKSVELIGLFNLILSSTFFPFCFIFLWIETPFQEFVEAWGRDTRLWDGEKTETVLGEKKKKDSKGEENECGSTDILLMTYRQETNDGQIPLNRERIHFFLFSVAVDGTVRDSNTKW